MAQNNGAVSMTSSLASYISPEKDVQFQKTKTEIDEKAAKIIKLIKTSNLRKKGVANPTNSEIISLVEDFHKQYLSLYTLHDHLREDIREKITVREVNNDIEDEEFFGNVEDPYYSADERSIASSPGRDHIRKLSDEIYLKNTNAEVVDLKNKLASMSEENEALNLEHTASLRKIQEYENAIENLKNEASASQNIIQEYEKIIEGLRIEAEEIEREKREFCEETSEQFKEKTAETEKKLETDKSSLKLEGENFSGEKRGLQEIIDGKVLENKNLGEENLKLLTRMEELEKLSQGKENQLSALMKKLKENESDSISKMDKVYQELSDFRNQTMDLKEAIDNMAMDLRNAQEAKLYFESQVKELEQKVDFVTSEKTQLEMQIEKKSKEAELLKVDNEELLDRISKLEKSEKKRSEELASIQTDLAGLESNSSIKIKSSEEEVKKLQEKMKINLKILERKIEDTAEVFCKELEDKIRILSRRIRVAEQLHMENKEIYKSTSEKYEKEHKAYKDMITTTEVAVKMMRYISLTANEILDKSDIATIKFNEQSEHFLNRISKASCEVLFAKDWVRRKNKAIKSVQEDADRLVLEMGKKESEILGLRERVWKSENKVRELEKLVKEKDDGMLSVGEEKREAIRQLCVWIEYHRSRCDSMKKILSDMTAARRQKIA